MLGYQFIRGGGQQQDPITGRMSVKHPDQMGRIREPLVHVPRTFGYCLYCILYTVQYIARQSIFLTPPPTPPPGGSSHFRPYRFNFCILGLLYTLGPTSVRFYCKGYFSKSSNLLLKNYENTSF